MKKVVLKHKTWFLLTVIMKVIAGVAYVMVPLLIQRVIACVEHGKYDELLPITIRTVIIFVFVGVIDYINRITQAKYMQKTITYMKKLTFAGIVNQDHRDFFDRNTSEYISVLTNDIHLMDKNYLGPLLETIGDIVIVLVAVGVLLFSNPLIATVMLGMSALILLLPKWFGHRLECKQDDYSKGLAGYTSRIKDVFLGYGIVEAYNMRKRVALRHESYNGDVQEKEFKAIEAISEVASLSGVMSVLTEIIAIGIGGYFVFKGKLDIAELITIVKLNDYLVQPMEGIAGKITLFRSMREIVKKVNGYIKEGEKLDTDNKKFVFHENVVFNYVTFAYDRGQAPILKDFCLKFEKGKKYAVVGSSGSGKSTIIRLLLRYYDCQQGAIYIDHTKIEDISKLSLYDHVGVIHQEIYMFDQTLRENIALGREYTQSDMNRALHESGVDSFLPLLDNGLDTSLHENGSRLSGGQRQRVAIARALLEKKEILLLDEATSALDAKTYMEIENTVLAIQDVTIISVTHRLTEEVLSQYDEIIVMDHGDVVEQGTFHELLGSKGYFYGLYHNTFVSQDNMNAS